MCYSPHWDSGHKQGKQKSCPVEPDRGWVWKCKCIGKQIQINYKIKTQSFTNTQGNVVFNISYFAISSGRNLARAVS